MGPKNLDKQNTEKDLFANHENPHPLAGGGGGGGWLDRCMRLPITSFSVSLLISLFSVSVIIYAPVKVGTNFLLIQFF